MSIELLDTVTNTADDTAVEIAAQRDLFDFVVTIQASAAAGTWKVEAKGPLGLWAIVRDAVDATLNPIFVVNQTPNESYSAIRITPTGTGNTNTFRAQLRRPRPGAV
jgi:hypothetical protein